MHMFKKVGYNSGSSIECCGEVKSTCLLTLQVEVERNATSTKKRTNKEISDWSPYNRFVQVHSSKNVFNLHAYVNNEKHERYGYCVHLYTDGSENPENGKTS